MKIAILTANLQNFDKSIPPVAQDKIDGIDEITFHIFNDTNFPPIIGLTPRLQYRIPKLFGWEMYPGYDFYIWLDASMSFERPDCVSWFIKQLANADMAFFRHPWRETVKQEVDHIETKLQEKNRYIMPRYENGLHKEMHKLILDDPSFIDEHLYASNVFIYRNNARARAVLKLWWYYQSRYFTVDQIALPFAIHEVNQEQGGRLKVQKIPDNVFKIGYVSLVSHH